MPDAWQMEYAEQKSLKLCVVIDIVCPIANQSILLSQIWVI
jgi:hypothetical protein